MTCQDIYKIALSFLGEDTSGKFSSDYEQRAPYLIAALYPILREDDNILRRSRGLPTQENEYAEKAELYEKFKLCDDFATAAAYYVASLLIFESDTARADRLFEKYNDLAKKVMTNIPFESKKTVDKYPQLVYNIV